jgi:hypothetical protein
LNFPGNWGFEKGDKIQLFINHLVKRKIGKDDISFNELYNFNPIKFTICVTNLSKNEPIYYNHINTPDQMVVESIRKSISIPVGFTPVIDNSDQNIPPQVYVDGGLLNNFPIDQLDISQNTLGYYFESDITDPITSLEQYLYQVIFTIITYTTRQMVNKYKLTDSNLIYIDTKNINSFNFFVGYESKKDMWQSGYNSTINYFKNFKPNDSKNIIE